MQPAGNQEGRQVRVRWRRRRGLVVAAGVGYLAIAGLLLLLPLWGGAADESPRRTGIRDAPERRMRLPALARLDDVPVRPPESSKTASEGTEAVTGGGSESSASEAFETAPVEPESSAAATTEGSAGTAQGGGSDESSVVGFEG